MNFLSAQKNSARAEFRGMKRGDIALHLNVKRELDSSLFEFNINFCIGRPATGPTNIKSQEFYL